MNNVMEQQVVKVQQDTQDNWSHWYNFTAYFRYPHISPLRRIKKELREHGIPKRRSASRVLEFGFGHGHLLFWFRPPTAIYGIELSQKAISAAQQRAKRAGYSEYGFKRVDLADSTRVDYPSDYFDFVVSSHTLEHVWDDEALMREFYRVLKPGGIALVVVPHDATHSTILASRDARRNPNFPAASYHVTNYNLETLIHIAMSCQFDVKCGERFDAVMSWRRHWARVYAIIFSVAMPIMPYALIEAMDKRAAMAGYPGMQAMIVGVKSHIP